MTHTMTTQPEVWKVIVGVDTHKHVHVAVAIDTRGIRLGDHSFVADSSGYQALLMWARTAAMITLKQIIVTASPGLRETLQGLTAHALLTRCAGLRPGPLDTPAAAKHTLRALARRWIAIDGGNRDARPAPRAPHDRDGAHAS